MRPSFTLPLRLFNLKGNARNPLWVSVCQFPLLKICPVFKVKSLPNVHAHRVINVKSNMGVRCAHRLCCCLLHLPPLFSLGREKQIFPFRGQWNMTSKVHKAREAARIQFCTPAPNGEKEISKFCGCHLWMVPESHPFRKEEREASLICLQRAKRGGVRMREQGRVNRRERKEMALPLITTRCCDARFSVRQKRGRSLRDSSAAAHSPYSDLMIL